MSWVAVGVGGATLAGSMVNTFAGKKKVKEDPSIVAARRQLLDFAQTGTSGNFVAGQDQNLGYGDYNATGIEQQGLAGLQKLMGSGMPDQFRMGDQALQDLLQTNPEAIDRQFDPFKGQVQRQIRDSQSDLKRQAAFGGNLYSTNTIRRLGDIGARGNETLTSELARLTDQYQQRKLQAIPLAYQSGEAQEGIGMNRIGASQQYGGLTRQLNDASIKARDAEILRRRQELLLPMEAAKSVLGGPSQMPITQSPYQQLLGTVGQIGGQYLGNELFMNQYKRFFPSTTQPKPWGGGATGSQPDPSLYM